jgi:hypothetical protein
MPSVPDWRSASVYTHAYEIHLREFAWEYLRRNSNYQRDYRTAVRRTESRQAETLAVRWGLRFPFRSAAAGRQHSAGLAAAA